MDLGMKHIDSLSVTEKISLYNCLYKDLAGKGIDGDTELAHVNKEEMEVLRSMGGSGTINPHTNLIQFGGGGRSSPPPTQTTTVQQSTFPEELKPFIKDIFGKAQAIQEKRESEGYLPFEGPRLAGFTSDQQRAFQGVRDTVGTSDPFFTRSEELFESSTAEPTAQSVGRFMNPFIQNVLDIERREARRDAETVAQNIAGRAARAGGFGGSREAILAAENERNTQRNLADIQTRGLASAFEDAQSRLAQQRGRELAAGQQFSNLGTTVPAQRLREFGALEATGATQQARDQQALDIAQQEFEIARTFPERTLQDYSSILRGFTQPLPASTFRNESARLPVPSGIQNLASLAGTALTGAQLAKGFRFKKGGLVNLVNGGRVAKYQRGTGEDNVGGNEVIEAYSEVSETADKEPPISVNYLPSWLRPEEPAEDTVGPERAAIKRARQAEEERRIIEEIRKKTDDPEYDKFLKRKVLDPKRQLFGGKAQPVSKKTAAALKEKTEAAKKKLTKKDIAPKKKPKVTGDDLKKLLAGEGSDSISKLLKLDTSGIEKGIYDKFLAQEEALQDKAGDYSTLGLTAETLLNIGKQDSRLSPLQQVAGGVSGTNEKLQKMQDEQRATELAAKTISADREQALHDLNKERWTRDYQIAKLKVEAQENLQVDPADFKLLNELALQINNGTAQVQAIQQLKPAHQQVILKLIQAYNEKPPAGGRQSRESLL